jgi:hypothetical protein
MAEFGLLTRHDFVTTLAILVVVAVAMATTATLHGSLSSKEGLRCTGPKHVSLQAWTLL